MLELRLAGIHDDGEHLVLESAEGTQFRLPIDQNLRTSIAKARKIQPARGRSEQDPFGPRDIQTRFRQGATVEEIVAESGWEAERVRRYEWPIIAERANIITVARRVVISQPFVGGRQEDNALTLDEHITRVADRFGFHDAAADWNTYQQESGQWIISLDFDFSDEAISSLPRGVLFPARWSYNPANQSIYASNEAAYFLMGRDHFDDAPLPGIGAHEIATEPKKKEVGAPTKLQAVPAPSPTAEEAVLDELDHRRGTRDTGSARERKLADLLARARQKPASPSLVSHADDPFNRQFIGSSGQFSAPVTDTQDSLVKDEITGDHETALDTPEEPKETVSGSEETSDEAGRDAIPRGGHPYQVEETSESPIPNSTAKPKPSNRTKRTSVPSWDDIIFGNQRK